MTESIANGVWPTMITPYTDENTIDHRALTALVEWYIRNRVDGIFAVCQSSEMFFLSLRERIDLARSVVKLADGRIPVIASGHVADALDDQVEEAKMMADTGVSSVVLVTNRFARKDEGDDVFKKNLERFLKALPETIKLGFYECPYPYKRLLNADLTKWCVESGRFSFLKDTSCNLDNMKAKAEVARNSSFKLFNANAATLLGSLKMGFSGYCGIMANFHADLYHRLCHGWKEDGETAQVIQDYLGLASVIEYQLYPANAMYFLELEGLPIKMHSRRCDPGKLTPSMKIEVEQFRGVSHRYSKEFSLS